jgi:hypothetical protein
MMTRESISETTLLNLLYADLAPVLTSSGLILLHTRISPPRLQRTALGLMTDLLGNVIVSKSSTSQIIVGREVELLKENPEYEDC